MCFKISEIQPKDSIESSLQDSIKNKKSASGTIFFCISLVGQIVFLSGLFLLLKKRKSFLKWLLCEMICICGILC